MIGILLNNQIYEQDIRELLMAFFPGETFCHEEREEVSLYVRIEYGKEFIALMVYAKREELIPQKIAVDFGNRLETKNALKRLLYLTLSNRTHKILPWGTLTGIRPTKLVMAQLEDGKNPEEAFQNLQSTYLTGDEKAALCVEIAKRETDILKQFDYKNGYSLYIGIPFCPTTCLYCSFPSYPIGSWINKMQIYLEALYKELQYTAKKMAGKKLDTIYFGGGTPTSLNAEDLDWLLSKVDALFDKSHLQEYTVEAGRPDSITSEKLKVLKKHGIIRISINPQTMKQATLDLIGRHHTVDMVRDAFFMAREMGFDNINMDLIIGLPEESIADLHNTMEIIKQLSPDSITVHSLAIKRAARLNMFKEQYKHLTITNTEEMIHLAASYASEMGLNPYYLYRQKNMAGNFENVGYAKPEKAGIYNILIMEEKQTIIACGAGSSSKIVFPLENRLERVENIKDVDLYIARIDEMLGRKEKILAKL